MKKLPHYVWLVLCLCCTKKENQKNTYSETPSMQEIIIDDHQNCKEDLYLEEIPTQELSEVEIVKKSDRLLASNYGDNITNKFVFHASEEVKLIGKSKTRITIPSNSFVYKESGKLVQGAVHITVKEYYKTSDILEAKLSTETEDGLLESRGMLHIVAKSNGQECELMKGKNIKIDLPTKQLEKGFDYYRGNVSEDKNVVWELREINRDNMSDFSRMNPRIIHARNKRVNVDFSAKMSTDHNWYNESENQFSNWLIKEFIKDFKDKGLSTYKIKELKNHTVFTKLIAFDFDTNKTNGILFSNVSRDNSYYLELKKMLKRIPKEVSKEGLLPRDKHRNFIMVKVNVDTRGNFDLEKFKREYDFSEHNGYYDYTTIVADALNWINCDRFLKFEEEQLTDFIVDLGDFDHSDVNIVFNKYNSIMRGVVKNGKVHFKGVPLDEEITIVATKKVLDTDYFAIKPTIITSGEEELQFKKYVKEQYMASLESLNNS